MCQPIIFIDSSHMSGPYGGALFSATTYDANDNMFPLAFGGMSSENYDDWSWFLQNVKKVVRDKKVFIISDKHQGLLCSVPEIFRVHNHAYCYRHLKENFSSFYSYQNTKGSKVKKHALQWFDKTSYARVDIEYNAHMHELCKFNDAFVTWIEQNELEY